MAFERFQLNTLPACRESPQILIGTILWVRVPRAYLHGAATIVEGDTRPAPCGTLAVDSLLGSVLDQVEFSLLKSDRVASRCARIVTSSVSGRKGLATFSVETYSPSPGISSASVGPPPGQSLCIGTASVPATGK